MHVKGTDKQADHRISTPGLIQAVRSNSDLPVRAWGAASTRDAAVERLCWEDVSARAALLPDKAGFAAIETAHGAHLSERNLHPSLSWRLWRCPFCALQPVAARLLAIWPGENV